MKTQKPEKAETKMSDCKFDYVPKNIDEVPPLKVYGEDFRKEFLTMWQCVHRLKAQHKFLLNEGQHFMFSNIALEVFSSGFKEQTGYSVSGCGHSGATEAYCARLVEFVLKNNWEAFIQKFGFPKDIEGFARWRSVYRSKTDQDLLTNKGLPAKGEKDSEKLETK